MAIDPKYIEILTELFNISIGQSANLLNKILSSHIQIYSPKVYITRTEDIIHNLNFDNNVNISSINIPFKGELSGTTQFIIATDHSLKLVLSIYPDYRDKNANFEKDSFMELSNILINNLIGAFSDCVDSYLQFEAPNFFEGKKREIYNSGKTVDKEELYVLTGLSFVLNNENVMSFFIVKINDYTSETLLNKLQKYVESMYE